MRCVQCNTPVVEAVLLVAGCCADCHSRSREEAAAGDEGDDEGDEALVPREPSAVARNVRRLKTAAFGVIEARERLPQPFFWSLFYSQIHDLLRLKDKKRLERKLQMYPYASDGSEN